MKRICPTHNVKLAPSKTQFGTRYDCPEPGCSIMCWDGHTSTPADGETRALRIKCHDAFDKLWQSPGSFGSPRRPRAYAWLAQALGVDPIKCHFGMFSAEQCRFALEAIASFVPTAETLAASAKSNAAKTRARIKARAKTRRKITQGLIAAGLGVLSIDCNEQGTWEVFLSDGRKTRGSSAADMIQSLNKKAKVTA